MGQDSTYVEGTIFKTGTIMVNKASTKMLYFKSCFVRY